MNIEIFALCDYAEVLAGKLVIVGPFDAIRAKKVPIIHHICTLAIRIRFGRSEYGKHPFHLNIVDLDGGRIVPELKGAINVQEGSELRSRAVDMSIRIPNLQIKEFGEYTLTFNVDNKELFTMPLRVVDLEAPEEKSEE
jgi:hypothetical protein